MFKVINRNYSKLTIKTPERRQWRQTYFTPCSSVSTINFEHVIAGWAITCGQQKIQKFKHWTSKIYEK